jgi:exonuclease III
MLLDQLGPYNVDITCLQEIQWLGKGTLEKEGHIMFYSCDDREHVLGVGFVVHRRVKYLVLNFEAYNPRVCHLWIRGKFLNYSIINKHTPTEESLGDKTVFYVQLEKIYDSCPHHDVKVIMGDANAQVGKEDEFLPVIGTKGLHQQTNNNREKLIKFAASRGLAITSTMFKHKKIHLTTWKSPDELMFNQIDHVLIDGWHVSDLLDVRTYSGANIDSDQFLLLTRIRSRISIVKKLKGEKNRKLNCEKLRPDDVVQMYVHKVSI